MERIISVTEDGKRRQISRKLKREKNPYKLSIGRLGDFELFCYPASGKDQIYIGLKHQWIACDIDLLLRFLSCNLARVRRIRRFSRTGVKKRLRFATKYLNALEGEFRGCKSLRLAVAGDIYDTNIVYKSKKNEEFGHDVGSPSVKVKKWIEDCNRKYQGKSRKEYHKDKNITGRNIEKRKYIKTERDEFYD